MTYDSLVNRGEYFSAHYLAEVFPKDLKSGLLAAWKAREEEAKSSSDPEQEQEADPEALPVTPRLGLRSLRRPYFRTRAFFAEAAAGAADDATTYDAPEWRERAASLNASVLRSLGYDAKPQTLTVSRADHTYEIPVAHAEPGLVAVDCGWAAEPDAALDPDGPGRLLIPIALDASTSLRTGSKLASFLFASEDAPRYVLLLAGGVIVLADRAAWGEGRYLAASLDTALDRNNTKDGQELDTLAALFGADSLRTPEEGGENPLAGLVDKSTKHAVGVSSELRDGLRESVELIANEVLERITSHEDVRLEDVKELPELSRQLTRESLRYLYRILFLLYAEARPELGILPSDYPEYHQGYGLGRLGELVAERDLVGEKAREGVYLYESLDLLFSKVQEGYRPRRTHGVAEKESDDIGLRFEPLHSKLFEPESIRLIGAESVRDPRHDDDTDGEPRYLDTRLRNATLYKVLRKLMLTRGKKGERGGFISYAQLGINQLGAVYEGLMSYAGFIAGEELYEVAKNGDPKDGSWLVPASKADEYADSVFVRRRDEETGADVRVRYRPGSFVYRLSGRDRQTSASYYTPESLTKVTVQLALQHRLDQDDTVTEARELLDWKICEPALGSGAFLNEAINQVAAEYLRRRQEETGQAIDTEQYPVEFQKAKAYIALHNAYGVDLNSTAVELAEVSLWLNTMHPGMEAPWFGLHLRRGNSLIGGRREIYSAEHLKKGGWLGTTPERFPLTEAASGLPSGSVHHFLLPAKEWGAVAAEKEAKALAPEEAKALAAWRKAITKSPSAKQTTRLQGLARRAEYLWQLVVRRLEISERDISRKIDVWGAEPEWLRQPVEAMQREDILEDLEAVDTPYWRLKTLMDAWCALWFWPVQEASLLDGTNPRYRHAAELAEQSAAYEVAVSDPEHDDAGVLMSWEEDALPGFDTEARQLSLTQEDVAKRRMGRRKEAITEQRRAVIPLANLDDWLDFAESLLGTQDVPSESLVAAFESLTELTPYEDALPDLMGMDRSYWLESRFPWAANTNNVAAQQGFFHWELEFAQIFEEGGYDLQVGNPPWVRPRWQEDVVLAELDPWFMLSDKPSVTEWRLRKTEAIEGPSADMEYFLDELSGNVGGVSFLGAPSTYPLIAGTQPNLYRGFMCRTWASLNSRGSIGLVHPVTHFSGVQEGPLREETYRHLRFHAHFMNSLFLFDIRDRNEFGINIYGVKGPINFTHMSWLFTPETVIESSKHSGEGSAPGTKFNKKWDTRPHFSRLVSVDEDRLIEWNRLAGNNDITPSQAALLYPVTTEEQGAITALSSVDERLGSYNPLISAGYHEKMGKEQGFIKWSTQAPNALSDVVLQGPHFGGATPFNKQPNIPCRNKNDWSPWEHTKIPESVTPVSNYIRACDSAKFISEQDVWNGLPYSRYYRLAWRRMIPSSNERSLFAALIPPGPAHVNTVQSMALADNRLTVLNAGFWAALPLDYLLRITGRSDLQVAEAKKMPAPQPEHPLASALLLRTLRLNCLTNAYTPIWQELFHPTWPAYEGWAHAWPVLAPLAGHLRGNWVYDTPLRTEYERRAALVELDALVSVWLGITVDQLVAIYKSRYPVLSDYEAEMYFDANGRKVARNHNTYGHGQTKEAYPALLDHLDNPASTPPPEGYAAPFYKADRETEMRAAHAHFSARLDAEIAAGRWTPPVKADA
ncbi:class I SAM-dependent DNA methyltransferase [Streptomyces erythrochromogenes]|uniref:class I SAM-dependent DNA methyltransferase n=1 Tax=Streptomyces erythrochromogenes TaxID=285574 RepID=UPI00224D9181|nr:class I SAM-dependent DNA methyltransferase [Streptomyces erythrochromogenes]MCX5581968.1 class I SAM-dependent DNA methyltransferase [Streptomyces erythrochromogenes]